MKKKIIPNAVLGKVAQRFKLLAEPLRLQLLNQLIENDEMTVMQLVKAIDQRQANVSKHLNLLAQEGILRRRKEGLNVYYQINDPTIKDLCILVCDRLREEALENQRILGSD